MFTENSKPRKRGRPAGRTAQGEDARRRLYKTAIALINEQGYDETTMRQVATRAGVSAGLLYRYFPSKRAVVMALYDNLSAQYAIEAADMRAGKWRDRFVRALEESLRVLGPQRATLRALIPVLVGTGEGGLFSPSTRASRDRIQSVFTHVVAGASDAPPVKFGEALGRLLYLLHLAVILWWLLDKTPRQRATTSLVALIKQILPSAAMAIRLPPLRGFVMSADALVSDALLDGDAAGDVR